MRPLLSTLIAAMFSNCGDGVSNEWRRFNGLDDVVEVDVSPGEVVAEPVRTDLTSTTGETIIGQVRIAPRAGPVGTEHRVVVQIGATWENRVERVELTAETTDRGNRRLTLERDSANPGTWVADLRSFGVTGESRTDTFVVQLYELVEVVDVDDPEDDL